MNNFKRKRLLKKAISRLLKDDFNGAINIYDKLIMEFKESSIYFLRSTAKKGLDDFQGAIQDIDKSIELSPNDAEYYNAKASLLRERGDLSGALDFFNKSLRVIVLFC